MHSSSFKQFLHSYQITCIRFCLIGVDVILPGNPHPGTLEQLQCKGTCSNDTYPRGIK